MTALKRIFILSLVLIFLIIGAFPVTLCAQEKKTIQLPEPQINGGKPLMQVLSMRKSTRNFSDKELSLQVLSNLLWAGYGINRPEYGWRTAPSAWNMQEISIYMAKSDGLFLYDAKNNTLTLVLTEDLRAVTGIQPYVKEAPVNLVFVADMSKMRKMTEEKKIHYPAADTGFISQNVYLFCASEGLGTVVRDLVKREDLSKAMKLGTHQKIILTQSVGYPKN